MVFGDANMIESTLSNLYSRVNYGMNLNDSYGFTYIDEAAKMDGGPDEMSTYGDAQWRVYDYDFVRNCNQFLSGLKTTTALSEEAKKPLEGEVRFLRAWCYFNMVRGLGGVPLMGDEVYTYNGPQDLEKLTKARATEAESYDYIISECKAAARDVIEHSPYSLQDTKENKGENFYNAVCIKDNNTEVMWSRDYESPTSTVSFSNANIPSQFKDDIDNSYADPTLNMVEMFEPLQTATPGEGEPIKTVNEDGTPVFYKSASAPFDTRDPRLLQAGQAYEENGVWKFRTGELNSVDADGNVITSINGPKYSNQQFINKTGFYFRKFLDESAGSSMRGGARSDMWWPYFRVAEAYMIACEAAFETGDGASALTYINKVRARAGVQPLQTVTFDNIVHENAVEFAFEFHRWWDLKRWRLADKVFNGNSSDRASRHRMLWPYLVVDPGNPHNGEWIFVEDFYWMSPNARYFQMKNYYNFIDNDWINKNPLLVKNPFQ